MEWKGNERGIEFEKRPGRGKCWQGRHEPFKALCYPWRVPEGHSYLRPGVCFVDLNRVTFAARNGPREILHWRVTGRRRRREGTSSEITRPKCTRGEKGGRGRRK